MLWLSIVIVSAFWFGGGGGWSGLDRAFIGRGGGGCSG